MNQAKSASTHGSWDIYNNVKASLEILQWQWYTLAKSKKMQARGHLQDDAPQCQQVVLCSLACRWCCWHCILGFCFSCVAPRFSWDSKVNLACEQQQGTWNCSGVPLWNKITWKAACGRVIRLFLLTGMFFSVKLSNLKFACISGILFALLSIHGAW